MNDAARLECDCPTKRGDKNVRLVMRVGQQPDMEEIMKEDFFGIICVTMTCPKMLHPVLPVFDETEQKCMFACGRIVKKVFDTPSFKYALKCGYVLERVHRFDRYKAKDSLWKPLQMKLFAQKMRASGDEPEDIQELANSYTEKFGEDFGDIIMNTAGTWGYKKAMRHVFKILNNCGWGKHAQRSLMPETMIISQENPQEWRDLCSNYAQGRKRFKSAINFGTHLQVSSEKNDKFAKPNLKGLYLPAAVFVPAYGRLQLCMELHKLEKTQVDGRKRVVMMDTDSVVAIYYPEDKFPGVYNVPEGVKLGDWEREDSESKFGGMKTFVGLGPKTYCFKTVAGTESDPKAKGVRLGLATSKLANFQTYERLIKQFLQTNRKRCAMHIPQNQFVSSFLDGIWTVKYWKKIGVNPDQMKGICDEVGYIWPFGYRDAPEAVELEMEMSDATI